MEKKIKLDKIVFSINIFLYFWIYLYSTNIISSTLFSIIFYLVFSRVFILNHDRTHTTHSNYNRIFETIVEMFYVAVVPWEEQYSSYKKKHLIHHRYHKKSANLNSYLKNPHLVFENGFILSFISSIFYSEIQFIIDIINEKIDLIKILFLFWYSILISSYIYFFSFEKFLLIFLLVRFTGFLSWFVFSYVLHQEKIYGKNIKQIILVFSDIIFGKRMSRGTLLHKKHHENETIPSYKL